MTPADSLHRLTNFIEQSDHPDAPETIRKYPRRARRLGRLMLQVAAENPHYDHEQLVRATKEKYGMGLVGLFAFALLVNVMGQLIVRWIQSYFQGDLRALAHAAATENTMGVDCDEAEDE